MKEASVLGVRAGRTDALEHGLRLDLLQLHERELRLRLLIVRNGEFISFRCIVCATDLRFYFRFGFHSLCGAAPRGSCVVTSNDDERGSRLQQGQKRAAGASSCVPALRGRE